MDGRAEDRSVPGGCGFLSKAWLVSVVCSTPIVLCQAGAAQNTIHVPGDFRSIQAAIVASVDGDEIIVAPGTYNEAINFLGRAVTLRSSDPDDPDVVASTIIDASGLLGSVVTCESGEEDKTVLAGFTITGGFGTLIDDFWHGGGMLNIGSSPSVFNCVFVGNAADPGFGGAIANYAASSPTIENCVFLDNVGLFAGGGIFNHKSSPTIEACQFFENHSDTGGGIANWAGSNPTVSGSYFVGNTAADFGGAIDIDGSSQPEIVACEFKDNWATFGGGVFAGGGTITECDFLENIAAFDGGGIFNNGAQVSHSRFIGNSCRDFGGGIIHLDDSASIEHCEFMGNVAKLGGGIYIAGDPPGISDSSFCENQPDHIFPAGGWTDLGGNVFSDVCAGMLVLSADAACYTGGDGELLTVTIDLVGDGINEIIGGQFFLQFDDSVLAFAGAEPGAQLDPLSPFTTELHLCEGVTDPLTGECSIDVPGVIEYLVGVDPMKGAGTTGDAVMAVLTFTIIDDMACEVSEAVRFDLVHPHHSTKLTTGQGSAVNPTLFNLEPITINSSPPILKNVPPKIVTAADAGACHATVTILPPTALPACPKSGIDLLAERSDDATLGLDDPFPGGETTIVTWTAVDDCGNIATATTEVTVIDVNELTVDVVLQNVASAPFERCIAFELYDVVRDELVTIEQTLVFVDGMASAVIDVPCGQYDPCLRVHDPLHTLRSAGDLSIDESSEPARYLVGGLAPLRGGDLNNDGVIDILDFGVFVWQFVENPAPGANADCETAFPHADLTGNGLVEGADFTFIQIQFLQIDEGCANSFAAVQPPRRRISVRELRRIGLEHLRIADLNRDGWLDEADIALFLGGGG